MLVAAFLITLAQNAASTREDTTPFVWEGRVVDAFTGAPVLGAECDLWTENMFGEAGIVARATTTYAGTYELPDPARRGQKLVLHRPGYRSTEVGTPEDLVVLFPRDEPVTFRVLDLDGRPVGGAVVQTRQSCRHAIPAVRVVGDSNGNVVIEDPPPMEDGGDVEVLAPGFGALGKLYTVDAWSTPILYLPRRRGVRVRVLDDDGAAAAPGTVRYHGESGGYPLAPDAAGWTVIDALFDDASGVVMWHRSEHGEPTRDLGDLPAGRGWSLRFGHPEPGPDDAHLEVAVEGLDEDPAGTDVRLLHEDGWILYGSGEHELPAGRWHLVVGAPFSGTRRKVERIDLAPGEKRRVLARLEPEPSLRILLPAEAWIVHVQAGDDSVSLKPGRKELVKTAVPPDRSVIVLSQGGGTRRATLAPWTGEAVLDLRGDETLLDPVREVRQVELGFRVLTVVSEVPEASVQLRASGGEHEDLDPAPDRALFRLPAGTRWEARFEVDGYDTLFRTGVAGHGEGVVEDVILRK